MKLFKNCNFQLIVFTNKIVFLIYNIYCDIYVYRTVFPLGVPQQFSFVVTFSSKMITKSPWHILKIIDFENNTNLQITLDQAEGIVEFSIVNYDGYLRNVTFEAKYVSLLWSLLNYLTSLFYFVYSYVDFT